MAIKGYLSYSYLDITTDAIRHWETDVTNWKDIIASGSIFDSEKQGTYRWYNSDFTRIHFTARLQSLNHGLVSTDQQSHNGSYTAPGMAANAFNLYALNNTTKAVAFGQVYSITYTLSEEDKSNGAQGALPVDPGSPYYAMATVKVADGDQLTMPYKCFSHWVDVSDGKKYYPDDFILIDHDVILQAVFEKVVIKVNFDTDSGGMIPNPPSVYVIWGGIYGDIVDENGTPLQDAEFPAPANEPSESFPKRFSHWEDSTNITITSNTTVEAEGTQTLTAVWIEQAMITIKYVGSFSSADPPVVISDKQVFVDKSATQSFDLEEYIAAIGGYEATFYMLGDNTAELPLTAPISVNQNQTVTIQYFSTLIHLEFDWNKETLPNITPIQFYSEENDGGNIVSSTYKMINQSELPVAVQLNKITSEEENLDGLSFVQKAENNKEFHLELLADDDKTNNGFNNNITNILPNSDIISNNTLGKLGGTERGINSEGYFTIGGKFIGQLDYPALEPKVTFHFVFTMEYE